MGIVSKPSTQSQKAQIPQEKKTEMTSPEQHTTTLEPDGAAFIEPVDPPEISEVTGREIKTGLYSQEPVWTTNALPMLRQSVAKELLVSPLHGWWKAFREEPEAFDDARNFGQICHSLLLGGKDLSVVDAPDWRTAAARDQRNTAIQAGKLPVLTRRRDEALKLVEVVNIAMLCRGILANGREGMSEITAIWRKNGVWCQGRIDRLILPPLRARRKRAVIYDFKFITTEATKKSCENRFIEHGYDIQHAAYVEAIETIYPKLRGRVEMIFVFVEVEPPNAIRIMPLAGSMRTSGQWRWAKARRVWRECLSKYGKESPWPTYADDGESAECPAWALNAQIEEARMEEAD